MPTLREAAVRRMPFLVVLLAAVACGAPPDPDASAFDATTTTGPAPTSSARPDTADPTSTDTGGVPTATPRAATPTPRPGGPRPTTGPTGPRPVPSPDPPTASPAATEDPPDPPRTEAPWDVEPVEAVGGSLAALRDDAADQCADLPDVPGVDTCLTVLPRRGEADETCRVESIAYGRGDEKGDGKNRKIRRGATLTATLDENDCEEESTPDATPTPTPTPTDDG